MHIPVNASPVSLSYVAALRGVKPRQPGKAFAYLNAHCQNPDLLTCLAASNPEGRFYGLVADQAACKQAEDHARQRRVDNVTFLNVTPSSAFVQFENGALSLPNFDYVTLDDIKNPLKTVEHKAVLDLVEKVLSPSGLFHYSYRAYENEDGALKFLVNEFAPEMNADQAKVFLDELKTLGESYFAGHPQVEARLKTAMTQGIPDEFFSAYDHDGARSKTFDTIVALRPRGFMYVGDAHVPSNYIELSVSPKAGALIETVKTNPLYEPIKDFAINRLVRSDIWCRHTAALSSSLPELFGAFAYGIALPSADVPTEVNVSGKVVSLASPLYARLIELMTLMPVSVGDFLSHPTGQGFEGSEVVSAVHFLVACGLARPMRGVHQATNVTNVTQPRLVGSFNQYLDKTIVTESELWLASTVLGDAVRLSSREALVMQALGRSTLASSVSALLPELERLAKNPAQATKIMGASEATPEVAHHMIEEVVSKSIIQWYAYGLMEAA